MLTPVLSAARIEFLIASRNRWVVIAAGMMALFALVLSVAGSAPTGELGADRLSISVASLTSLAVYLVPLMALLISFDAIAGEIERGTLALHVTYPVNRGDMLLGKLLAQLAVITLAIGIGYACAAATAFVVGGPETLAGLPALWRLFWTSVLLGAVFLSFGHALSATTRRPSGAAGLAIALWLVLVVLYDLGLLAALVADDGGAFTQNVFPWLLVLNPSDAFRVFNLSASNAVGAAAGLAGAAQAIAPWKSLTALVLWPVFAAGLARFAFSRVQP